MTNASDGKPKTITVTRELLIANAVVARDWRQKQIAELSAEGVLADLHIEMERAFRFQPYGIRIKRRFTG